MHNQIIPFAAAAALLTVFTAANIFDILLLVVVIVVEGKRLFLFLRNVRSPLSLSQKSAPVPERSDDVTPESHPPGGGGGLQYRELQRGKSSRAGEKSSGKCPASCRNLH